MAVSMEENKKQNKKRKKKKWPIVLGIILAVIVGLCVWAVKAVEKAMSEMGAVVTPMWYKFFLIS